MATDTRPTTFVTGAAGFIGLELAKVLVARRHRVFGLADSAEAAERVRRAGAVPVMGHPLDAGAAGSTRQIVYVADTSCYGATGTRPVTEDTPPQPSAWCRCLIPALERLQGYIVAGHPIVTALPGWVYGNGGWFRARVIEPVIAGRRVLLFGRTGPRVSPIHFEDCARALVHLAEHGEPSGRYFLVNRDPIRLHELAETFARLTRRPLRVLPVPALITRLVVGPVLADHLQSDALFSNIRLRGIGFRFLDPTLEDGLQQVVGVLDE